MKIKKKKKKKERKGIVEHGVNHSSYATFHVESSRRLLL